uniref:DUF659 domain-containing protein n=1 Tax=Ditylenchus dipsaci TaxID=166011 RepID=A0A915E8D0_9BILA
MDKADFLSISSDGWTDVNSSKIINVVVHCPKPFLLNSIDATKNRTQVIGEYIAKLLAEEINAVGKSKVVAIVTDHAANMRSAWRLLAKDYPWICSRMQGSHAKFGNEGYLRKDGDRWLAG